MFASGHAPLCRTGQHDLASFGSGIALYLKFLKALSICFTVMTVLSLPAYFFERRDAGETIVKLLRVGYLSAKEKHGYYRALQAINVRHASATLINQRVWKWVKYVKTQLTAFSLRYCDHITDASVIALSNGCPQLTRLNLEGCHKTSVEW